MPLDASVGGTAANAYCDSAYADSYHSDRGNAAWAAATSEAKDAAIVRATGWLEREYYGRWRGSLAADTQALSWPRAYVVDGEGRAVASDAIPAAIKSATAEVALVALSGSLESTPSERAAKRIKQKVGPIETETEYAPAVGLMGKAPFVAAMLRGMTTQTGQALARFY